jgi:hypothetical protein
MTNFSAVWVAEKLTTLTSTRPAAWPARITASSEISGRPFGRITHSAPFGRSEDFSFPIRLSSASLVAPRKIASLALATRPIDNYATAPSSSCRKAWSWTPSADTRHSRLAPSLASREGG